MGQPQKFSFDTEFADEGEDAYLRQFTRVDVDTARDEGWRAGLAEGATRENATFEGRQTAALADIAGRLGGIARTQSQVLDQTVKDATALSLAIARKIAPELVRSNPVAEIEAMIGECLRQLIDEPRVVVRAPDELLDELKTRLDAVAESCGYEGRIVLLGDETLSDGDCRVEWADGGAERDTAATWRDLETAIDRLLTAPAETPVDDEPGDADGAPPSRPAPDTAPADASAANPHS